MKLPVHDRLVQFRTSTPLLDAARTRAAQENLTITELLRGTLRAAAQGRFLDHGDEK